jgi:hypothetical protein
MTFSSFKGRKVKNMKSKVKSNLKRRLPFFGMMFLLILFVFTVPACDFLLPLLNGSVASLSISIDGNFTPNSGSYNFGDVVVGSSSDVTVTIENTGDEILRISGINFLSTTDQFSGDWSFLTTVGASQVASFTLTFAPTTVGVLDATIAISSDASNFGQFTFDVSGTGISGTVQESYQLSVDANEPSYGAVTPTVPTNVDTNTAFTITATPNSGYEFLQWIVLSGTAIIADSGSSSTTVTLTSGDAAVQAQFQNISPASWTSQVVDSLGDAGSWSSLILDSSDSPYIAYYSVGNSVKLAHWNGTAWVLDTVDSSINAQSHTSLAIHEATGAVYPHISYYDVVDKDLKYSEWNGSAWSAETVVSDLTDDIGDYSALALDAVTNDAFISYIINDTELHVVRQSTGSWQTPEIVDANGAGWSDIVWNSANALGNPLVVYIDSSMNLKVAYYDTAWSNSVVDSSSEFAGNTSAAVDNAGNIHLVYFDSANNEVKYANYQSGWSIQVTGIGDNLVPISGLSSTLDGLNYPHISFVESGSLIYAWYDGAVWTEEVILATGVEDLSATSIELSSTGVPYISFYYSSGDLGLVYK